MTIGGDPDDLDRLAAAGPGHAFTLTTVARSLERAGDWHLRRSPASRVHTGGAVCRLRTLAQDILGLDAWVGAVADALRTADRAPLRLDLLALGVTHPLGRGGAGPAGPPSPTDLALLTDQELDDLGAVTALPVAWRDPVNRARVRRWIDRLPERVAAVPPTDVGFLARWADRWIVDRVSAVLDLHRTQEETTSRLEAAAAGARRLLARPDLTVLSFAPGDPPTIRVALGDPTIATHLAVLLPGTGSGLHAARTSLDDVAALHRHAALAAPPGTRVATVLDLYAAPPDLGHAVDPGPSLRAGAATAVFLDELGTDARTTLVGHSYGALTAARASDGRPVDDLVLLGAPGAGVAHRDDLPGAARVWAARASGDPIGLVADADELLQALPPRWRPDRGPLAEPLVAHGPDPTDPEFGALRLPTAAAGAGVATVAARGHLDYLTPGTTSLDNVAGVVLGRRAPAPVTRGQPPRQDRRG